MTFVSEENYILGILAQFKLGQITARKALQELQSVMRNQGPWFKLEQAYERWNGHRPSTLRGKYTKDPKYKRYFQKRGGTWFVHETFYTTRVN